MGPNCFPLLARERATPASSLVPCIDDTEVSGVSIVDPCERDRDIVLMVVIVLDSVIVAADSLWPTVGE